MSEGVVEKLVVLFLFVVDTEWGVAEGVVGGVVGASVGH
jgi:hypothetical protein